MADLRPDFILTEMFVAAAGIVAEQADIPLAVMGWPAPPPHRLTGADEMVLMARQRLDDLLARFGLTGVNWTADGPPALCAPRLHLTYWSPGWFDGANHGPQTVHVGGLRPRSTARPSSRPGPARARPCALGAHHAGDQL